MTDSWRPKWSVRQSHPESRQSLLCGHQHPWSVVLKCDPRTNGIAPSVGNAKLQHPHPLNQSLHFNKIPRWFICRLNLESWWSTQRLHVVKWTKSESRSVVSSSLQRHGLYSPWNSPGQNTGVGSLSLLQRIFPTQGLNLGLLHGRRILYRLSHKGNKGLREHHYEQS